MNGEIIWLLIGAIKIMSLIMVLLWFFYLFFRRAEIVDLGWTIGIGILSTSYFMLTLSFSIRPLIVFLLTIIWSGRLSWIILERLLKGKKDARYQILSEQWSEYSEWKFLLFFLVQGLAAVLFSLPMAQTMSFGYIPLAFSDGLALMLFLIGFSGVYHSDQTLRLFKEKEENRNKVCQEGLWHYSRHPNYFFELIIWSSFALFAFAIPWGFLSLLVPFVLYYLIQNVTGIPATEQALLLHYGEEYKKYQSTTSVLFPRVPKQQSSDF